MSEFSNLTNDQTVRLGRVVENQCPQAHWDATGDPNIGPTSAWVWCNAVNGYCVLDPKSKLDAVCPNNVVLK